MEHHENSAAGPEQLSAAEEYTLQSSISESYTGQKRNLQQAFPDLSPSQDTKRFCSRSPAYNASLQSENNDDALAYYNVTFDGIVTAATAGQLCMTKQAQSTGLIDPVLLQGNSTVENGTLRSDTLESNIFQNDTVPTLPIDPVLLQETSTAENNTPGSNTLESDVITALSYDQDLAQGTSKAENLTLENNATDISAAPDLEIVDDAEYFLDYSRHEISRYLTTIKQHTSDGQIDLDTVGILADEIFNSATVKGLATPEHIAAMRGIFPSDNVPVPSTRLESDQTFSRDTTSPLSDSRSISAPPGLISPLPSSIRASDAAAAPSCAIDIEIQNKSTQTEPEPIDTLNATPNDPITNFHDLSNTILWRRELELIRRLQPLVVGPYTRVKVPLREATVRPSPSGQGVEASTQDALNNNHRNISDPRGASRRSLRSGIKPSRDSGQMNREVISLSDTDDENEDMKKFNSRLAGGGDLFYGENGPELVPSEEDDEETSMRCDHSSYKNPSNVNSGTSDDFPDYEDINPDDDIEKDEGKYPNHTFSMGLFDGNDDIDDDYNNTNHQDDQSDRNSLNYNDVMRSSSSRDRGRAASYRRDNAGRSRSRSPDSQYQRGSYSKEKTHRENRHYSSRYQNHNSLTWAGPEKPYDAGHIYIKDGYPARAHWETSCEYVGQRYIRDEPQGLSFYGYNNGARSIGKAKKELRYQDRFNDVGEIPGPKSSLRLKLDEYMHDAGSDVVGLERSIKRITQETFYASETFDEEQALQVMAKQPTKSYKGFPLVEEIGFITMENRAQPEGDCYWRALAHILHGKSTRWNMIKADHLVYIQHVLSDKTHPRHQLYARLNTQFFDSSGGTLKNAMTPGFKANIWQLLHLPHSWTPGVMQQITADLYNIHLVTFAYDRSKNLCSEVSVRGVYNSRHVFMLFTDNCHFQPLAVNEYLT
ncbi:hypothetical protein GGR55DRAFT_672920 [Xylaria sp. FL0064]|nr:hypothetical protein GGR55DRAFT_672920 [Xylaria sp. FL0064]